MLEILSKHDAADSLRLPKLRVELGCNVAILGGAASGKTQFCLALAGLDEPGDGAVEIVLEGHMVSDMSAADRARTISFVPSDAALSLSGILASVKGELEIAWRLLGHHPSDGEIYEHALLFGLCSLLDRDSQSLSGGETTRLALAAATVKRPKLLVLDQVLEHLDPTAIAGIRTALATALPRSSIIVETRSRQNGPTLAVDASASEYRDERMGWQIAITSRAEQLPATLPPSVELLATASVPARSALPEASTNSPLLQVNSLEYCYPPDGFALGPIDLSLARGERVALVGPSGSGKTTFLKALALLLSPKYEKFEVRTPVGGVILPPVSQRNLHTWARQAIYCFQRPEDQLYLATARAELFETARRLAKNNIDLAIEIARELGLEPFLDKSPFDLPRPHRRLLTIASALAAQSPIFLLDEPSAMLDDEQVASLVRVLETYCTQSAIVMVTHDQEFLRRTATDIMQFGASKPFVTTTASS